MMCLNSIVKHLKVFTCRKVCIRFVIYVSAIPVTRQNAYTLNMIKYM